MFWMEAAFCWLAFSVEPMATSGLAAGVDAACASGVLLSLTFGSTKMSLVLWKVLWPDEVG